jgi:hypothetical protein
MKHYIRLIPVLALCIVLIGDIQSDETETSDGEETSVVIKLIKLDMNDQTLELHWKIKNSSDHNVWICDSIDTHPGFPDFEVFMDGNNQTLVIRRRFDLPVAVTLDGFLKGRYMRLRSGEERVESLTLHMPASLERYFEAEIGRAEYARSLALEIGFYDEDLRELILNIVGVAEKLNCADPIIPPLDIDDIGIRDHYFAGLIIARTFNSKNWPYFKETVEGGGEEILIPHMGQIFKAEQVLKIRLDGVSIPYSQWPPLTDHAGKSNEHQQIKQMGSSDTNRSNNKTALDSEGIDNSNNTSKS